MIRADNILVDKVQRYREAGDWLLRLGDQNVSGDELVEWLRWCEANPDNLVAFERLQQDWHHLGRLKEVEGHGASVIGRPELRSPWPAVLKWGLAAGFVLLVSSLGFDPPAQPVIPVKTALLPDGSALTLSPKATVAVDFGGPTRRVVLNEGDAYFKVQHDKSRPFVVMAGQLAVTAVGTAFDVRRDADQVVVTVAEGTVRIDSDGADRAREWTARAGDRLAYLTSTGVASMTTVDASKALRWRSGELSFNGTPLNAVIDEVNRYSNRRIVVYDAKLNQIRYTGTVFTASIDEWLRALTDVYPVRSAKSPNGDIQLESRPVPEKLQKN